MSGTKVRNAPVHGRVGQRGRLMIPTAFQKSTGITEGTEYVIRINAEGALIIETVEAVKRRLLAAAPAGDWDAAAEAREDSLEEVRADHRAESSDDLASGATL